MTSTNLARTAAGPSRVRALVVATALVALGFAGATALTTPEPAHAADPLPECPDPGEFPDIGNTPTFTDNNVNVFAGGDFQTGGTAEIEGLVVVSGDASIDHPGTFNVGRAGVGSGISPEPGTVMFRVGDGLTVSAGTTVDVGSQLSGGGGALTGGAAALDGMLETNGGDQEFDLGREPALGEFAGFAQTISGESDALAAVEANGTVQVTGAQLHLTGAGEPGTLQVFTIDAADLDEVSEVYFEALPEGSAVLVNVQGAGPDGGEGAALDVTFTWVSIDGERVDDGAGLGNASARTLWNFPDVTDLTIGGSSQFIGSVLAPRADALVTASTNGRVYVGGDLTADGTSNELHAYPWIGSDAFGCVPPEDPDDPDADTDADAAADPDAEAAADDDAAADPDADTGADPDADAGVDPDADAGADPDADAAAAPDADADLDADAGADPDADAGVDPNADAGVDPNADADAAAAAAGADDDADAAAEGSDDAAAGSGEQGEERPESGLDLPGTGARVGVLLLMAVTALSTGLAVRAFARRHARL